MNYYFDAFKRYADFEGVSSIKEFWMFILFNFLAGVVISTISWCSTEMLNYLYSVAVLIPSLAIIVRRLRDSGRHWTWILVGLIPVAGQIWLIVLLCQPTKQIA